MKAKYLITGLIICLSPSVAFANIFKDLFNAAKTVAKEYTKAVDSGKCAEVLSPRDRARVDAITSSGIGGKVLGAASIATNIYSSVTGKDVSSAQNIMDDAVSNYNDNNRYIAEKELDKTLETKGVSNKDTDLLNSIYSLGSSAYSVSRNNDIQKENEAFMEANKNYTDPHSSVYDPYFEQTLKYDNNGRIIGRMDPIERINTIKEINKGKDSPEWNKVFNETVDKNMPAGADRSTFIEENRERLTKEAFSEISQRRKENIQNYTEGKYNVANTLPEPNIEQDSIKEPEPVESLLPEPLIISGYELNVVEVDSSMAEQLDSVYALLCESPDYNIVITGNTCDLGNDRINDLKGQQRADNAKEYLLKKGISESRIGVVSAGANNPIIENSSKENRKLNRRIEIVFNK